jgi:transcriptional regulator of acetoin/glycerol metabolism
MRTPSRSLVILALFGALAGCATIGDNLTLSNVVAIGQGVQKVQEAEQTEFTPEQEYYIGRAVAANLLSTRKVWNDQKATTYLNVLERALTLCTGPAITPEHIQLRAVTAPSVTHGSGAIPGAALNGGRLGDQLEEIEREAIVKALEQTRYNKTAAARLLGITFRALRYRIKKLGIE